MTIAALITALKDTAEAAQAEDRASKVAFKAAGNYAEWRAYRESDECKALEAACTATVGRVTVTANMAGNSRRQHVRHTFKVDGKRASRIVAEAAL